MKKYTISQVGHRMWSVSLAFPNPKTGAWIVQSTILFSTRAAARAYVRWAKNPH